MISSEESVGEKAAEKREEEGGSHEVRDGVGGFSQREMHVCWQIPNQIACIRQKRQVFQHLHAWKNPTVTAAVVKVLVYKYLSPSRVRKTLLGY